MDPTEHLAAAGRAVAAESGEGRAGPIHPVVGHLAGFKAFLLKSSALALAIGVIIGAALGGVVNSLVNDIIMPPIGLFLGRVDFRNLKIVLQPGVGTDPNAPGYVAEVAIRYGTFLNLVIVFIIVAFVVYMITLTFLPEAPPPPSKTCPYCKEPNALDASKCRACASEI
jgi:large conductance mechanosensitive channel